MAVPWSLSDSKSPQVSKTFLSILAVHNNASFFFSFTLWTAKSTIWQVHFIFLTITRSGRVAEIRWSLCISTTEIFFAFLFSRTDSGLCVYHLFARSHLNFLYDSPWITLPTQSCVGLYSFCANLLHSLMWLIVSSLSPHNPHELFWCVLSILCLT